MPKFLNSKEKHLSLNASKMVVRSTLNFVYFQSFGYEDTRGQVFSVGKRLVKVIAFQSQTLLFKVF
ncbi:hypothetical protein [Pseudothermotoga elfii]|uniref:hypothetical protein n=1 Tax=Pseudothermotoga elfii TaxID=38322 RepID=UPI00041DABD2|nr:hypothetical protein [Pseudothermotoga elfii]